MSSNSSSKSVKTRAILLGSTALIVLIGTVSCGTAEPNLASNGASADVATVGTQSGGMTPGSSSGGTTGSDAYASIPSDEIAVSVGVIETTWNLLDPFYFYDEYPLVASVRIDSIDGGRNYSPIAEQYVSPFTVGKMTVIEAYKGEVEAGAQLPYARLGGIVAAEEYMKGLSEPQRSKSYYLSKGESPQGYIKSTYLDDIDIEVGKNYLVFLSPEATPDGKVQDYAMQGMQYGLREVQGSGAQATVLNNETGEWESLSSVVRLDRSSTG